MELSDADLYVSRAGWDDQSSASQDAGDAARGSGTALRRDLHATFLTNKGDESAGEPAATGGFLGGRRSKSAGGAQGDAADASARLVGNSSQIEIRQETKSTDYYPDLTGLDEHEENRDASFIHARARSRHGSTAGYAQDYFEEADDRDAVASVATSPSTRIRLHRSGSVDISVDSEDHGGDQMSELDMSSLPSFPGSHRPRPLHVPSTSRYTEPYHNTPQHFANYGIDNSRRTRHGHEAASMWPHTRSSGMSGASSTASFSVRSPSRRSSVASSYGATMSAWDRVHQADNVPPRSAAVISAMGALQDKIRSLEKSLEQERERNLALRTEAETARQSFEAKAKTMHAENDELASKVRMLEQAKRQACHHAEKYRSKLAEVTASMEAAQAENNALAQQSAETEGKLAEASAEHARATEEATRAAGDLRAQIDLKEARVKSLQEELVAVDSQKIEAQAAIRNLLLLNEDLMNKLAVAGGGGGAAEDPDAVLSSVLGVKQPKTTTMTKKKKKVKKVLKKKKKTVTPRSATTSSGAMPINQRKALSSGRQVPSSGAVTSSVAEPVATRKSYPYRDQHPSLQVRISNKTQVGSMSRRPESIVATSHAAGARRLARPSPRHGAPDRDQIQRRGARKSRGWSLDKELLHANADHPVPFLLGKNAGPSFSVYGRVQEELADPWAYGIPSPRERAGRRAQRDARGFFQEEEVGQDSEDDRYDDEENEDENDNSDEEDEVKGETDRKQDEGGRGGIKNRPNESKAVGAVEGSVGPPTQEGRARRPPHLILSSAQEAALAHAQGLRSSTPTPPTSPTKRASRRGSGLTDLEASLRGELDTLQRQYQILVTEISSSVPGPGSVAESNSSELSKQTGLRKSRDLTEVVEKIEIKTQQLAALEGLRRSAAVSPRPRSPVRSPEAFDRKVQALRTLQHFREEPPYL